MKEKARENELATCTKTRGRPQVTAPCPCFWRIIIFPREFCSRLQQHHYGKLAFCQAPCGNFRSIFHLPNEYNSYSRNDYSWQWRSDIQIEFLFFEITQFRLMDCALWNLGIVEFNSPHTWVYTPRFDCKCGSIDRELRQLTKETLHDLHSLFITNFNDEGT